MDLVHALLWDRDEEEVEEVDGLAVADRLTTAEARWVCGAGGLLARSSDDGMSWTRIATGTTCALVGISSAPDAIWVCGSGGFVARVRGELVEPIAIATTACLRRVCAAAGVALGDDGALHPLDARDPAVATGASGALTDLAITAHGTWIVVGEGGFIARSPDGRWFSRVVIESELDLRAVAEAADGTLVAVGAGAAILASRDDGRTWRPIARADAARLARARTARLDDVFAAGPDGFIASGLAEFLAHTTGRRARATGAHLDDFTRDFGVPLPDEARRLFALVDDRDQTTFDELRVDLRAARARDPVANRFEQLVCARELVDAFCGVFAIGTQGNGDSYHLEIYEWDGPRQVLHFDHETASFTGVLADALDSLVYLCALVKVGDGHEIAPETYAAGLRALRGRVSPTWHFSIDDKDPDFVRLSPTRHNTEFFYCRARWICALLETGDVDDVRELFDANLNEVIAVDQLPARFDACARYIPTALYAMWRAYLFDEPELARYLEIGRAHAARLVRDAALLIDELRAGRARLGPIADVPAWLARFRALDLDPRRTEARTAEAADRARHAARRRDEVTAELAHTPELDWPRLAWSWLHDGSAHRALIVELGARPDGAVQLAALEVLGELGDDELAIAIPRVAIDLSPVIEALLLGSLVRDDRLDDLPRDPERELEPSRPVPSTRQRTAALAMTARALRLAPHAADAQLAHAMLLLDADRAGVADADRELLAMLPRFAATVRIGAACQMGGHPRFRDVLDIALADAPHDDVASEMYGELGEVVLEHAPDRVARLVDQLPDDVELLCELASLAIEAGERDGAVGLYDRMLAVPIPDERAPRQRALRALNNACIQAHAGKVYDAAVRIADRVQGVAHDHPALFHAAACAYAAVGDLARALEQVKHAIAHDYDQLSRIAVDTDLRGLLAWPAFQAVMRDVPPRAETGDPEAENDDDAGELADSSRDLAPVAPGAAPRANPLLDAFTDGGDGAVDTWIAETPHPREDVARMLAELAVAIVTSDARGGMPGGAARPRQLVTHAGLLLAARAARGHLDPRAAAVLRPVLDVAAKFEHRRRAVVEILGALRDRDAVSPMLRILGGSAIDKEDLLAAVARALGAIADPVAIPMLARVVASSGAYLDKPRTYAANALASCLAVDPRPLTDDVLGGLLETIAREGDAPLVVAHAHLAYARLGRLSTPAQREHAARRLADTPTRRDDAIVTLARQVALAIVRPAPISPVEADLLREGLHRALGGRSWDHDATVRDLALALAIGELVPALVEAADLVRLTRFAEPAVRLVAHALLATLGRPLASAACFDRESVRALSDDELVRWLAESHVIGIAALVAEAGWRQLARARPTIVRLAGQVVASAPPRADLLEPHARLLAAAVAALRDTLDAPAIVLFDRMLRHPNPNVKWALLKHPPHDERLVGGMLHVLGERWGWQEAVARAWLEPYAGMPIYETERLRAAGSALQPDGDAPLDPEDDAAIN